jgi:hypothetical protein
VKFNIVNTHGLTLGSHRLSDSAGVLASLALVSQPHRIMECGIEIRRIMYRIVVGQFDFETGPLPTVSESFEHRRDPHWSCRGAPPRLSGRAVLESRRLLTPAKPHFPPSRVSNRRDALTASRIVSDRALEASGGCDVHSIRHFPGPVLS